MSKHESHGMHNSPEWRAWKDMKARCSNPTLRNYPSYGGRGISVCEKWRGSFSAFLADVGLRPSAEYSLERIANDGNYEPGNVRWATRLEQARNTRRNRIVEHGPLSMTVSEWGRYLKVPRFFVRDRLDGGWSIKQIINAVTANHFKQELAR